MTGDMLIDSLVVATALMRLAERDGWLAVHVLLLIQDVMTMGFTVRLSDDSCRLIRLLGHQLASESTQMSGSFLTRARTWATRASFSVNH